MVVLVMIVGAVVTGLVIYRSNNADPAPPVYDAVLALEAAPEVCTAEPLGYITDETARACQVGFSKGAMTAWSEDEQRWTTPEERDAGFESTVKALVKREILSDLTPEQVESAAFLAGYRAGAHWMENDAPRA